MPEASRVPYPIAARGLLRDTVLGAVDDLVRTRGWSATTMSDVASAAGVSRQTVYNEFRSRAVLVEAYVAREIELMLDATAAVVRAHSDDAHVALREAFTLFLRLASDEPVVQLIVGGSADGEPMRLLTQIGQSLAGGRVSGLITEVWPQVSVEDAVLLAQSLVRLAISHSLLAGTDPATAASGIGRLLGPFVDVVLLGDPAG